MHRGEIVQNAVNQSGLSVTEVARRIKVVRQTVYNYYGKPNLSVEIIQKIGKAIHHDFSGEIRELKLLRPISDPVWEVSDDDPVYGSGLKGELFWKEKYYAVLEAYTELLKEMKAERLKGDSGTGE